MDETLSVPTPKRKRRWYQFSLRTLFVVVTLLSIPCGYVGWQARIVRERRALRDKVTGESGLVVVYSDVGPYAWNPPLDRPHEIPWIRDRLGDEAVIEFDVPRDAEYDKDAEDARRLFPEATIERRPFLTTFRPHQ